MLTTQYTNLVDKLIQALRFLPGVGPKTAQRLAFHLLQRGKEHGLNLAKVMSEAINNIKHCKRCNTLSEFDFCTICGNHKRDRATLCIVESPIDIFAIEQTGSYRGLYFVLMGHLSPLDGIGPEEIGIENLLRVLDEEKHIIKEIVLATNHTVEGDATAHYITNLVREKHEQYAQQLEQEKQKPFHLSENLQNPITLKFTRIAHGIPVGGELEYIDSNTLSKAIKGRVEV